jgi:sulfoxide reductase heme-binding subunit YedZ
MGVGVSIALAAASTDNPLMWYLTRTTAMSAYVVLALLVSLGLMQSNARVSRERLPWVVDALHQFLGLLFGVLVVCHILTLMADPLISFSLSNVLLPLDEPYRPFAVALGVLALWTMVLILLSSWMRRHLSQRVWRLLHYLSFTTFVLITAHGILAGTDASEFWMLLIYIGASAVVGFLTILRLLPRRQQAQPASLRPR